MSLLCFIQGHAPASDEVWNRGYSFSKCRRCHCDLIRSDGEWETVPRGHRVAWKKGRHHHSRPPGYVRNLPVLYRLGAASLPAPWFGGWYRHILMLAAGGGGRAAAPSLPADDPEREPRQYPYLLALAAVAGAGLQLLFAVRPRRDC
ncbi:MAG: hypothetical protein M3N07_04700 [Pseudomonadota bacterium]|nr:hypothetical protein [Pseudomonadota bacterium]